MLGLQTVRQAQRRTQGAGYTKRRRGRASRAKHWGTEEIPTRSQNSQRVTRDKREKQSGTFRGTCPRAYHRGAPPLVVPTDHLRPSGLLGKYLACRMGCLGIRSNNSRIPLHTSPDGRRQQFKSDIFYPESCLGWTVRLCCLWRAAFADLAESF